MPDITTTSQTLDIEYGFVDGDTRTSKIKNPKANITSEEIEDLNTFLRANNAIVGDRYGSTFARINSAKRISKTTTTFDINS